MTLLAGKIYSSSGLGYSSTDAITWQMLKKEQSQANAQVCQVISLLLTVCYMVSVTIILFAWEMVVLGGLVSADLGFRGHGLIAQIIVGLWQVVQDLLK